MNKINVSKIILAAAFLIFTAVIFIADMLNGTLGRLAGFTDIDKATETIINNDTFQQFFLNINGNFSSIVDMRGYYNDIGIYITEDKYIVSMCEKTTTDYEFEQTVALKEYLDEKGINLIYINQPAKYLDDSMFIESFGKLSYSNRNADLFLKRIREAGINTVDLRDELLNDGLNINEMFYRTDHHWTMETGLWAAEKMAESLNTYAGYNIDLSIYDTEKYNISKQENCWLGEQGMKLSGTYIGFDNYIHITPDFPTSFHFKKDNKEGNFDDFINYDCYKMSGRASLWSSWHYSYRVLDVINNNVDTGKVLMVCDSYANATLPFLALSVSETDHVILRNTEESLRDIINKGGYDTVIICYAQFMIGAHDVPESANYRMFDFE